MRLSKTTAGGRSLIGRAGDATLRLSESDDCRSSAWYVRLVRLGGGNMRAETFLPTEENCPTEEDFKLQLDREEWSTSVNNHDTYTETETTFSFDEAAFGALDSVNIFSTLPNYVSEQLRGIEWVSIRCVAVE